MPLTDAAANQAKPRDKDYKLADGGGMFLLVKKDGSKYWRLKYRFDGKEKLLALGVYPAVSLANARRKMMEAKLTLANGEDPGELRKGQKRSQRMTSANAFELIAREWWETAGARITANVFLKRWRPIFSRISAKGPSPKSSRSKYWTPCGVWSSAARSM